MPRFTLSRRAVLRGLFGTAAVSVALPPLEAMFNANGTAHADGTPRPRRFGVFFFANGIGVYPDRWYPAAAGPLPDPLPPNLAELTPHRLSLLMVSGADVKLPNVRGHHAGTCAILSAAPPLERTASGAPYGSTFSAPSIDQLAARAIGTATRLRSLEVGVSKRTTHGEGSTMAQLSHNGPDSWNPTEVNPAAVFNRLFGSGVPTGGAADPALALRQSMLDVVGGDARRLSERLGAADRQRLEAHLEGVEALRRQLSGATVAMPGAGCGTPSPPGDRWQFDDVDGREQVRNISRAMNALVAMALACDLTRVFTLAFARSGGSPDYDLPDGTAISAYHHMTHTPDSDGLQPTVAATVRFTMGEFADLVGRLAAIPDGDGTLLDHCAILATSDCSDGRHHLITNYPIVVAGGAGGRLRTGVHVQAPGANTSHVLFSLLRAVGVPLSELGAAEGRVTDGLAGLEV